MSTSNLIMLVVVFVSFYDVRSFTHIIKGTTDDEFIQSEHYPNPYPRYTNVTWEWKVESGQWGVVFKEFSLDSRSESADKYDKLEINDRQRPPLTYTTQAPPRVSYVSEGPQLVIHFVSDGLSEPQTRGFRLYILHGANKHEVEIKIHEATKPLKELQEEKSSPLLIAIIAALAVIGLGIILVVVILIRKNKQDKKNDNRNAFGVRRNSGISHSRRTRSTDEPPPDDQQLQQQQQHPRRIERTVQRSNSQLNWMARAELTTTIQKAGCASRPNNYTSTDEQSNTSASSNNLASPTKIKSFINSSCANGMSRVNNHRMRSYENNLEEYSDTFDSLSHNTDTHLSLKCDHVQGYEPPSYEESHPFRKSLHCTEPRTPASPNCYENVFSIACPSSLHQGNQTNIYINSRAASESSRSINEITIDATKCVIKSSCCENLECTGSVEKSAHNMDTHEAKMVIYQNTLMQAPKKNKTPSVSSVQIIDGYAFIVPSSSHQVESEQHPPSSTNGGPRALKVKSTNKQDLLNKSEEASQNADSQDNVFGCEDAYVNLHEN